MATRISRTLDPTPFRAWANQQLALPPIAKESLGEFAGTVGVAKLAAKLGLDKRQLHRWRFENKTLERIDLEEALGRADVPVAEVYSDLEEWPEIEGHLGPPPGFGSKLTDDQVRVLHRLHTERDLSIRELGRRIYKQVGYTSAAAAEFGIRRGFRRLCLAATWRHPSTLPTAATRRCKETKTSGKPCEAFAVVGSDLCWPHANRDVARQRIAAVNEVRFGVAA